MDGGAINLKEIVVPNGVIYIGIDAFYSCNSLISITIPSSLIQIGNNAFYGCKSLTSITFEGTVAQWNKIKKGSHQCESFIL